MTKNKKLLFISSLPVTGEKLYPHLSIVFNWLCLHFDCDFYFAKERGLNLEKVFKRYRNNKKSFKPFIELFQDLNSLSKIKIKYDLVIALDDFSFLSAKFAKFNDCVLWSHDFIPADNNNYPNFLNRLVRLLVKFKFKNSRIIIQDEERRALYEKTYSISFRDSQVFYLPVSLPKIVFKYDNCQIRHGNLSLIQIGGINTDRSMSHSILDFVLNSKFDTSILFHGYVQNIFRNLFNEKKNLRTDLSEDILHPNHIPDLLSNYDVGVVGYKIMDSNFYFISNASNQLVEFLRCGLPIIVIGDSNLNEFVVNHQIGFSVTNQIDFDYAIEQITNKYSFYQNNSANLFNKQFSFELYEQHLLNFLHKI